MSEFSAEDFGLLSHLLETNPSLKEVAMIAKIVLKSATFPINSYGELAESLAKAGHGKLTMAGSSMSLEEIRSRVPSYYFPINSERDLLAKITELVQQNAAAPAPHPPSNVDSGITINWSRDLAAPPHGLTSPKRLDPSAALDLVAQAVNRPGGVGKF